MDPHRRGYRQTGVEAPLKDGDRILLGKFLITFARSLEGKVVLDEAKPLSEEAGTIIRSVGDLSKLLAGTEGPSSTAPAEVPEVAARHILRVLADVSQTLIGVKVSPW